ncbi:Lrp/AsnC family transcriptional regulator [Paenibacillus gorillae]|uniref:Lrp/AsnC family transcriptional regulator n=1 Tax=Paenibacillus gorillae TaxID=1243662 RepID=UPI0004B72E94|nr:Lrp/AsnC family transcriptional regulator [Paenibacillus gorillae]
MSSHENIDEVDLRILNSLLEDATQSHKAIGELVHLTGQAVGARIRKLQDLGVIEGYTLRWNPEKLGLTISAFIIVFLQSPEAHQSLQKYIQRTEWITEAHRVSGEGCYWLRAQAASTEALTVFLDELLQYGNYKISISIDRLK